MPRKRTGRTLRCATCESPFYRGGPEIRRTRGAAYCSVTCYTIGTRRQAPTARPGSPCKQCGTDTRATESWLARGYGKFCSSECSRAYRLSDAAVAERFWAKVDKAGPAPPHRPELGPCWIWLGSQLPDGYGRIHAWGRLWPAHQLAWRLTYGAIPAGLWGLHHCDTPPCVRPEHLFLGTNGDNMRDMVTKGRGVTPRLQGEQHQSARLTEKDVRDILARPSSGRGHIVALAHEFKVSQSTVSDVLRRVTWTHIT